MWTVHDEPVAGADAAALIRAYFTEIAERYWRRAATPQEIDDTLAEFPSTGFASFLVLRAAPGGEAAGCLGLHPTGELSRFYVAPEHRRGGAGSALLHAAESTARARGLTRLFLDTRHDLVEARLFYAHAGFTEIPPPTTPGLYQDHWFEKPL